MSALGGTRHWLGPAVGAVGDHRCCSTPSPSGNAAVAGRALIGLILIVVIVFHARQGSSARSLKRAAGRGAAGGAAAGREAIRA